MERLRLAFDFRSPWFWLGLGLLAVLIRGLFLDVMDVDASQYASISMEMLQNGSWLEVHHRGADYLDKPPLLFWLSAGSFALFGIGNWTYKLPSLLAALLAAWSVYRFCLLYYTHKASRQAAFMLLSALGLIVICNDVRTDTLLLGATTCAIWQLAEYLKHERLRYLFGGFFCIGLAMLAKGPIGLVVTGFGVGTHLLLSGQWRAIFKWQWLLGLLVTALVLAPMCWGLWRQFDLHPEKLVNERHGVSGLYFFFWEQSFGRVTGENVWHNDASAFYFLHVYLWAFLPWCLLLPGAFWQQGKNAVERQFKTATGQQKNRYRLGLVEYISLGAFTLSFIALSTSQYKLPHYIFITLPWAAVLVAGNLNLEGALSSLKRWHWIALYVPMVIGLAIAYCLPAYVFPTGNFFFWAILLTGTGMLALKIFRNPFPADSEILVQRGVWTAVLIGFVVNFHFYPQLLPYQSGRPIAEYAKQHGIPPSRMAYFHRGSHALDFYNGDILERFEDREKLREYVNTSGPCWVQADEPGKGELELAGVPFEIEQRFSHFQVALLKAAFLNPERRSGTLETVYLLKVLPENTAPSPENSPAR